MNALKKILNVTQTRASDAYTIQNKPISSLDLMENAAQAFVTAFEKQVSAYKRISVVCGVGNNGGDGLAVCRLLQKKGMDATAILVQFKASLSEDCLANKNRLKAVLVIDDDSNLPDFHDCDIIIDALFGSGLNSSVRGLPAKIIEAINLSAKTVYSIDVPSGLHCDSLSASDTIVKSAHVICFQRPKLSFFFPENSAYIKSWEVVDIGLDESFIQAQSANHYLLDQSVSELVKSRSRQSHKGTYGHALLMVGSYGKMGAAVLSAKACLRSGVGLLTCYVPKTGYNIMQISVPEAMCITDSNETVLSNIPNIKQFSAIGIGPGIGSEALTVTM
ncbi:MAG: NAD(P)H-hydrate epimerase, partial [Putridiphycobacter sp.]|nr:NAD(P)H-hydrate epimerase [Putridiphycobacter sp.]